MRNRCLFAALLIVWLASADASGVEPPVGVGVTGLDLKTQLEKGLQARRPVEFAYIAEIVRLVEKGKLPRDLVTTTFVWARQQPTRPLQYFQFALATRARRLPVTLPDLQQQTVGTGSNGGEHGVTTP